MDEKKDLLYEFARAISVPLYNTDGIKWPVRSSPVISHVGHIFAVEYASQVEELVCNYDPAYWAGCFPNSVALWRSSHHMINGLEKAMVPKKKIADYCFFFIKLIQEISHHSCLFSQQHIILEDVTIRQLYEGYDKIDKKNSISDILSLSVLLWAYAEALYFQAREICCEYHGLYQLENGTQVLVRDFNNFYPKELWAHLEFEKDIKNIRIVTYHDQNFSLTIDAYNNVNVTRGSFYNSCIGTQLFINGKIQPTEAINSMTEHFTEKLSSQMKHIKKLNINAVYEQYAKIFWFRKKGLGYLLGHDYTVPEQVLQILSQITVYPDKHNPYRQNKMSLDDITLNFDYSKYI